MRHSLFTRCKKKKEIEKEASFILCLESHSRDEAIEEKLSDIFIVHIFSSQVWISCFAFLDVKLTLGYSFFHFLFECDS